MGEPRLGNTRADTQGKGAGMKRRGTACAIAMVLLLAVGAAACGGTTNQTETPGEPTSAAPLPSVSPTGGGGGGGETSPPAVDGEKVFAADCSSCHGETGQGGFGPDLTGVQDTALVEQTVAKGRGQMPAFEGQLSAADISAVAGYVVDEL